MSAIELPAGPSGMTVPYLLLGLEIEMNMLPVTSARLHSSAAACAMKRPARDKRHACVDIRGGVAPWSTALVETKDRLLAVCLEGAYLCVSTAIDRSFCAPL